jgi:hypothetical protein
MGKELQTRTGTPAVRTHGTAVREYDELPPMYGVQPYAYGTNDVPEWCEAKPPYGTTQSLKDRIDRTWSSIIRYPRYAMLFGLWVTFTAYRFAYVLGTVVLIVAVIVHG